MTQNVRKSCSRLLIFIAFAICGGTAQGAGMSIRQLGSEQLRLSTIGYRLGAANARACSNPQMLTGLVVHDLTQYRLDMRAAVTNAFALHDGVGVLEVVPNSVAAEAGLKVDDEILSVGGMNLEDPAAVRGPAWSYRRIALFSSTVRAALRSGTAELLVRRDRRLLHVRLRGQAGCGGETFLISSRDLNAWSDGTHIVVSSAMMQLARNDDQLAFIVAHEMAHNLLGHSSGAQTRGLLGLFGVGALQTRREESAADAAAVPLMMSAGYAAGEALGFLENARRILWWDFSLDHPGFGRRMRTVAGAIAGRTSEARAKPLRLSASASPRPAL